MIGQGSPIKWNLCGVCLAVRKFRLLASLVVLVLCTYAALPSVSFAEEINVRLRLAWGSGDSAKHRWVGKISCVNATLTDLQPLGIEADAPVAIQLNDNQLFVNPWEKRGFDGCDITIQGDADAAVRFELRSDQSSAPTQFEVSLGKLAKEQVREPLDSLGSFLLAYRSPGDRFRVLPTRDNLVFQPGETWPLRLTTDFATELSAGPVVVEVVLRAIGSENILWQSTQVLTADSPAPDQLSLEMACPTKEGAYRLSLSARSEESFATRFVPGQGVKPFATREIDLVVIDPAAKLSALTDHWLPVLSIDPANPSWWQLLPTWAQVSRLTGKPPGAIGNVRLLVREGNGSGLVELPPSSNKKDPYWQSFALPVLEVGVPHLIEIVYPLAERQHLGVSVVEPDAAGRVMSSVLESSFYVEDVIGPSAGQTETHRIVFWPRTSSPQLLIVNRHSTRPAVFGRITLSRHDDGASLPISLPETTSADRLVAGYIAKPIFAQNFGAAEVLDPASGMSVQSWSTFLDGARRLVQHLKLSGYNSVLVSVAADGSALYPSSTLMPSPRYDTGMLAASGQDPVRKDVLEMLLRVCDREGIRAIATMQLAAPLPQLETLRSNASLTDSGVAWINAEGRQLIEAKPGTTNLSANYNLLNSRVQQEASGMVLEVVKNYGTHASFTGVALQLDSHGLGVLPGLDWGFDDQTIKDFSTDTGIEVAFQGDNQLQQRAAFLLDEHRGAWQTWRIKKLTQFYRQLAQSVQAQRPELKLILTTENLFREPSLGQEVRLGVSNSEHLAELLAQRGIDLKQLSAIPGVEVTNACRVDSQEFLQEHVVDLVLNAAAQDGNLLDEKSESPHLAFHEFQQQRLPSFNERSPFGADRTHLVISHQATPAGAAKLRHFVSTVGDNKVNSVIEGGEFLTTTFDSAHRDFLRTLERLPNDSSESRSLRQQPLSLQVSRTANETYLICSNESPWSVTAKLDLESPVVTPWQKLGSEESGTVQASGSSGQLIAGASTWALEVAPYGLQAWRINSSQLRVQQLQMLPSSGVRDYLQARIQEIEARTGNLNIVRDYPQLQNPGFELEESSARIFGWQPRKGERGSVEVETTLARSGARSLRLLSEDNVGVAVQSHLFSLPASGMLIVGAKVRAEAAAEDARITIAVETDESGQIYRRTQTFGGDTALSNQWTHVELAASDLPVGDASQIRVQFHVTGKADVMLDDIQLCDLRFDDQRRSELVKRVFAAKTALAEDQVVDCLRLLDEYGPRYLVEYVPPIVREPAVAKQPIVAEEATTEGKSKVGSRLRGFVPRIWRQ